MKISSKGRYALEAIVDLAYHGQGHIESLKNVAERLDISKNYLEQIFISLKKEGIVESVRGAQGGYRLKKPMERLTAGEVIRALEGDLSPVGCISTENCMHTIDGIENCVTRVFWEAMALEINKIVDSKTIADLVIAYEESQAQIEYYI